MNVQNMASRFMRIPLRVAWISTGIATLFAVLLIVHQDLWIMGTWLAHITSIPWQYAVLLIGLAAMLLSAFIAGIAAVIISFQGTKEMRSTLSMMAEASALYAAGKLSYRMDVVGTDDLSMIAQNLNSMAARLHDQVSVLQEAARHHVEVQKSGEAAAVLRERERVRRELHDRVSQELFGLSMLSTAAAKVRDKNPEQALKILPEIEQLAKHAQGAMRALLLELRPLELHSRQLIPALQDLATEMASRTGIDIEFRVFTPDDQLQMIDSAIEDALFLIAQETMVNALKHAAPRTVNIDLNVEHMRVVLRVVDDGKGFVPTEGKWTSLGLRSIQERAQGLGGSVYIKSGLGKGTEILCIIPRVGVS